MQEEELLTRIVSSLSTLIMSIRLIEKSYPDGGQDRDRPTTGRKSPTPKLICRGQARGLSAIGIGGGAEEIGGECTFFGAHILS